MQIGTVRYVLLSFVLLASASVYTLMGNPRGMGTARWPEADTFYAVDQWSVGPQQVALIDRAEFVTRDFERVGEQEPATLTVVTSQEPKVLGAGAEVPFLGAGYSVQAAPQDPFLTRNGINTLVARSATDQWLVLYAYGERRGLVGNGPLAWTYAVLDGMLGRPNDYYKLYLMRRIDTLDEPAARGLSELAHTLFPRIAIWYAA